MNKLSDSLPETGRVCIVYEKFLLAKSKHSVGVLETRVSLMVLKQDEDFKYWTIQNQFHSPLVMGNIWWNYPPEC